MNNFEQNNIKENTTPAENTPADDVNTIIQDFEEQTLIEEIESTAPEASSESQDTVADNSNQQTPPQTDATQEYPQQNPEQPQPHAQAPQGFPPHFPEQPQGYPYPPYGYAPYQIPTPQQPHPAYGAPQNPEPYMNQAYAPQPQMPAEYFNTYPQKAPKEKMSGGLKAVIIIVIAILTACVVGFIGYLAYNYDDKEKKSSDSSNQIINPFEDFGGFGDFGDFDDGSGGFGIPDSTAPTFSPEQSADKTYDQSDASDKVDPDFKGIELEKKPKDSSSSKYDASYTFNAVKDAVVGIACYYEEDKNSDNYQSQGTGIIVTSDGYVVTNSHVIGNSRKAYLVKVITADKKEYEAGVVGYDSRSDLAVLKIEGSNLPVAKFGDSTYTQITEEVVAIGNPSGIEFQNSVTKGIVSALDRKVSTSNNVKFIQIDAAINPGNSGGPLCNMYGQVIGINTAKIASESYEGMGFAIPSATVKKIVDDIIRNSYVTNRVKVGITGQAVYESQAGADGIQIVDIAKDGPMDGTGAQKDDIITEVDGEKITTFAEIYNVLEKHKEGDKVKIKLYRPSTNKTIEIEVTLQMDKAD